MQSGWRRQPRGKALQVIRARGGGISQPLRFSNRWQMMSEDDIRTTMLSEGCSGKMIENQLVWFRLLLEQEQKYQAGVKSRRHTPLEVEDEELLDYIGDVTDRRRSRYKQVLDLFKDSMSIGGNRMGHMRDDDDEEIEDDASSQEA
jgi:hypothetical protein